MSNNKLVSIIIPVFNAEPFIRETLNSVLGQTYDCLEVICIDDRSTDNSFQICKEYCVDLRVHVFQNEKNSGQEFTRNRGLRFCHGDYFTFVDADDTIDSNMITRFVFEIERTNADLVFSTFSGVKNGHEFPCLASISSGLYSVKEFANYLLDEVSWNILSCIGSKLYRSTQLQDDGIFFKDKYKYNEDCAYAINSLQSAKTLYFINEPFYKYLLRSSNSAMSSHRKNAFITNIRVYEELKHLFIEQGIFDEKEGSYYEAVYQLILSCLINEVKFGTISDFFDSLKNIRAYYEFREIMFIAKQRVRIKHKLIVFLLNRKYNYLLYNVLKIYVARKKRW